MENLNELKVGTPIDPKDQGPATSEVFSGDVEKPALKQLYSESPKLFADIIRSRLDPVQDPYRMLDVGTFKGDLVRKVKEELGSEYNIECIGVDINEHALRDNDVVDEVVVANISELPFDNDVFDVVEARYVLAWNDLDAQKSILSEMNRVCKRFAIIQHAGADGNDLENWQNAMHSLLMGGVDRLKRDACHFSSAEEVENMMKDIGLKFTRVQHRRIERVSDVFIERYKLSSEDIEKMSNILGEGDYIYQTTWVIDKIDSK